ncbi:2,4-dienoyl-CoA reductase-like NADH-dependent reductase (Old Yellow Enzyme family) [Paraburkholderia caballeronis]|uniref:NADH:flavin oxidoreductase/NADH oxidase n=1 Tax=Paraburkholderia caballeronis TaxID=416943 RepID=UPI0010658925|nr:NADH:flavin oxidoreductase/NADH oxidase [Paraburkholderia caballeronis]TDV37402.1 2,4-dienoyl-CoA reductase-like NADH-dependent reductase (Old Yellow Enzyme family) [Paraburkholderia caballeronis]
MSKLFTPLALRGLTLANRIVVSPMCQYSAQRGEATDWHMIHLGHLALSGAGMLCIEATAVEPDGRITPGDLGLWDDVTENALKPVLETIRRYSPIRVAMQISHAGRKASSHVPWEGGQLIPVSEGGWLPHAPSALPHKDDETPPLALDAAGLNRIREAFAATTRRAARLGIDAIEVHAAHGYLLHEFLSPVANQRTDEYGGSRENRMRFPLEIFDIVRAAFPDDRPVGVRVSATDWVEGGWTPDDTVAFAHELKRRGADWIDVSSGGVSPLQKIPVEPAYQVPFARKVKQETGLTTIAVGLITDPLQANQIVDDGDADMIAMARAMLYDPRWPWHAAAQLGASVSAPPQYWRSQPREQKALFGDITIGQR